MNRRDFGKLTLAAAAARQFAHAKPNSKFGGVQIGAITYSFRTLPVEKTLDYCLECGISGVEMMSNVAETFAGAPQPARATFGAPSGPPPGGPGGGRPQMTPERRAAIEKAAAETKQWRLSASMTKYKELRKIWTDAGVKIYAFKLPPTMAMSNDEYDYIWNVAETLGANHITMELPEDDALLQRVGEYAAKRKLAIAFHTHGQGGDSGFDRALAVSKFTALNLDVGHYFAVTGKSPLPVMEKYHDRISSLHLKDRKGPADGPAGRGGPNMPWGQGATPLKEILQLMKAKKFKFPASVEYEYNTPEGSDVLAEMKKCVAFCKTALS